MLVSSWESKIQQVDKELEAPFVKCIELPSSLQNHADMNNKIK